MPRKLAAPAPELHAVLVSRLCWAPCFECWAHALCLDLGSVASDSMWGISSDLRYTPADEQKMYCGTLGRAFRMGSASEASRPLRSYTAAQAPLSAA